MAETVTIAELGAGGDGIAEIDGRRVFVPFTLPGEDVSIERTEARGRVVEILRPSPDRVAPACRHFGTCGGCALQHMEARAYHAWKRAVVEKSLALHGIAAPVEPIVPIVPASRRRAVLSAMKTAKGTVMGFHRRGANEIVPIEECPVLETAIVSRLPLLRRIAEIAARPKRRARLTVVRADNGLDIALDGGGRVDRTVLEELGALGVEQDIARLSVNGTTIFVNRRPEIATSGGALFPPPGGFVQAAATAEARLAREVLRQVGDAGPVADLFAGIGTFTLPLAKRSPVTAMEGDKDLLKRSRTPSAMRAG